MYKKELEINIFGTECNKMIDDITIKSFYDSRNYSIGYNDKCIIRQI